MGLSWQEIIIAFLGGGGILAGLISALNFISARLDTRRKNKKEDREEALTHSTESERIKLDGNKNTNDILWRVIEEKNDEIASLEKKVEDAEKFATLTRPNVIKLAKDVRDIRKEIESLNLMILNEEETNVFMRRFQNVKVLLDDIEAILP
jgi:predicted RNase H-like nuclease (RuvC/YqgF family)